MEGHGRQRVRAAPRRAAVGRAVGRWLRRAALIAGAVLAAAFVLLGGRSYLAVAAADLRAPAAAPVFLDRYGGRIVSGPRDLQAYRPLDAISPYLRQAVVAMEDVRFWHHPGIDPIGIARAYLNNVRGQGPLQGASTITQQLARTAFLTAERTLSRKINEAFLALALEARYGKAEILELYLNRVFFGEGANGAEAAARLYFGKPASELNLAEAALLAGLLPAPNRYSPFRNPELALERRRLVLRRMAELDLISPEEAEAAAAAELRLAPRRAESAAYFTDYVTERLVEELGPPLTFHGRLEVMTTLDPDVQRAAEEALAASGHQGAIVVLDVLSGDILALVGGRDYRESQFNRAVHARRQPGSAFKPIVYAAALERHWTPNALLRDEPREEGSYRPSNWDGRYRGPVTMAYAMAHSLNAASVWLLGQIGPRAAVEMAQRLGIDSVAGRDAHLALALGALRHGVSPLRLAEAYTAFATGGVLRRARSVLHVQGPDGREWPVREGRPPIAPRVLSPHVAYMITDMLREAVESGTGAAARLPVPVAGKTGSTNDNRDAWFVGYTPRHLAVVFIGHDDNRPLPGGGGALAAPVWRRVMASLIDQDTPGEFPVPQGMVRDVTIDPYTGLLAGPGCPERIRAAFLRGTEPRAWAPCAFAEGEGRSDKGALDGDPPQDAAPEEDGFVFLFPSEDWLPSEGPAEGGWLWFRRLLRNVPLGQDVTPEEDRGEDDNTLGTDPEGATFANPGDPSGDGGDGGDTATDGALPPSPADRPRIR